MSGPGNPPAASDCNSRLFPSVATIGPVPLGSRLFRPKPDLQWPAWWSHFQNRPKASLVLTRWLASNSTNASKKTRAGRFAIPCSGPVPAARPEC